MKRLFPILMIAFISLTLNAAAKDYDQSSLVDRELEPFRELILTGVFNVEIKTGNQERLVIDADEDRLAFIVIENKNGILKISTKDEYKNSKAHKIKIYVTCKELDMLKISGVGNVYTENAIKSDDMDLIVSSVGRTALEINTDRIMSKISAVGEVVLEGKANNAIITTSGVGNFDASDFMVEDLFITNSGIGNVQVYAKEELDLKSTGIGGVTYYGNPEKKNVVNSGIGKVKHIPEK